MPLRERVSAGLGLPAALDNDANCAVLGEWWRGAARGTRQAIGITIGTGIGGGIILDGQLYHGASDCAGEIGHITIEIERTPLQLRQLRLPRGLRLGARHRAARRGGGRTGRREPLRGRSRAAIPRPSRRRRSTRPRPRATTWPARWCSDTAQVSSAPAIANLVNVLQPRGGGRVRRRDARRREPLRAAPPRGDAPRLPPGGGGRAASCPGALTGSAGVYGAARVLPRQPGRLSHASRRRRRLAGVGRHPRPRPASGRRSRSGAASRTRWPGLDAHLADGLGDRPADQGRAATCAPQAARVPARAHPPGARGAAASRCRCPTTGWCCATSRRSGAASGCRAACPGGPGRSSGPWWPTSTPSTSTSSPVSRCAWAPRRRCASGFRGPIYADLHSLFLGMQRDGMRMLQPLPDAPAWFGCFDVDPGERGRDAPALRRPDGTRRRGARGGRVAAAR